MLLANRWRSSEYLDETVPNPPLLPADALGRARVRQIAYAVACDIHPFGNTRVQHYLRDTLGRSEEEILAVGIAIGWRWIWRPSRRSLRIRRKPASLRIYGGGGAERQNGRNYLDRRDLKDEGEYR